MVKLFIFPLSDLKVDCFFGYVFECCFERYIILNHQLSKIQAER